MKVLLFPALLLPAISAVAEETLIPESDATELGEVVVTATRTAQTVDESLSSVSVVTRADIERRQARSVPDALDALPGVTLSNSGGRGQPTTLFLRGSESDHVLVLVDGVKLGSPTLGIPPLEQIPIESVERIEVVRGPRSSLYGSEAIGGVIQVFTRKGGGPLRPRVTVGGGSFGTVSGNVGISGGGERHWLDASLGFERSKGFDACEPPPAGLFVGCGVDEPDADGFEQFSASLRAGGEIMPGVTGDLHFLRSEGETEYDGSPFGGNENQTLTQVLGAKLNADLNDRWHSVLAVGRSWDDSQIKYSGLVPFVGQIDLNLDFFDTRRTTASWQNDISIADDHLVTLGIDWQRDAVDSTIDFQETERDNAGVFGEYQGHVSGHDLNASLRYDDNEQFGSHTTGSAAWGYAFNNGPRVTANYGTAFKAPTFNELYWPDQIFFVGNPDLRPETSESFEFGLSGDHPLGRWSLNAYQSDIDDLIAFDVTTASPANLDTARIRGLEAIASASFDGWDIEGNLTLMDPRNRSDGPNRDNLLSRRPQESFRLDLDRRFDRWRAGATVIAVGRRFEDFANTIRMDSYALVDLRAGYAFSESLSLDARLENLLDEDYETAAYYNQPGRAFYLTLRYQPGGGER